MTQRLAVLLRGINVGGHNRVPMAGLRAALEATGRTGVETYIQSGNIALDAMAGEDEDTAAAAIETLVEATFGLRIAVVVRDHASLARVVKSTPFAAHRDQPERLLVGFAQRPIAADAIRPRDGSVDELVVDGREIHLWCPNGLGQARLPDLDRQAGTPVTVRNWATVGRLVAMTARRA